HQRVAIGWRSRKRRSCDATVCTGSILDDNRLAKSLLQPAGNDAGHGVGQATRRKWHDKFDGLGWIGSLGLRCEPRKQNGHQYAKDSERDAQLRRPHGFAPWAQNWLTASPDEPFLASGASLGTS